MDALPDDFQCKVHPRVLQATSCADETTFVRIALDEISRKASAGDAQALRWLEEHGLVKFPKKFKGPDDE